MMRTFLRTAGVLTLYTLPPPVMSQCADTSSGSPAYCHTFRFLAPRTSSPVTPHKIPPMAYPAPPQMVPPVEGALV
jgi:hypothetical protein